MSVDSLEPLVGVFALRTFRVSVDGFLLPVSFVGDDWAKGLCIAGCRKAPHSAPDPQCTCGLYSLTDLHELRTQYWCRFRRSTSLCRSLIGYPVRVHLRRQPTADGLIRWPLEPYRWATARPFSGYRFCATSCICCLAGLALSPPGRPGSV